MVVVKLIGGLGNQLFQYAFGKNLSLQLNRELILDISSFEHYDLHKFSLLHFNIVAGVNKYCNKTINKTTKSIQIVKEHSLLYNKHLKIDETKDLIYLDGYWQSEKYFIQNKSEILSTLTLKSKLSKLDFNIITLIKESKYPFVSMHVRRGDYVDNKSSNLIHGTCSVEYYKRAYNVLKKMLNSKFAILLFSDDLDWVKVNFDFISEAIYCDHNDSNSNFADLYLMTLCHHNVIANSTFSWWGAELNLNPNKIVISPAIWFNDFDKNLTSMNIIPENWIRI